MSLAEPKAPAVSGGLGTRSAPIRVLLIGGSTLFRTGLCALIEKSHGLEIAAHAVNPAAALQHVGEGVPDVVLLDIDPVPEVALRTLQHLRNDMPAAKVLILADGRDAELGRRMARAGASGLVSKDGTADHLLTAIRRAHNGESWVDRAAASRIASDAATSPPHTEVRQERVRIGALTAREKEVIALVARGSNNKSIAAQMNISDNTVRHHLTSIFGKLGVPDRLGLVVYAFRHKLVAQQM